MLRDFFKDLEAAKPAEQLVLNTLASLATGWDFVDVSNLKECRYKGDIKAINKLTSQEVFLEVKNDSRIADTGNILCEYQNYIKDGAYFIKGNMLSDYDYYCIVSQQQRKIYIIDFSILKANYTKGTHKVIYHYDQDTWCYLLPLGVLKSLGGLVAVLDY